MVYPVVPREKQPIIAVREGRFILARYTQMASYQFTVQRAVNWEVLEAQARQAVEDLIGEPIDDDYPCPDELAALAVWPVV